MKILSILEQNLLFLGSAKLNVLSRSNEDIKKTKQNHFRATEGKRHADPELQEKEIRSSFSKSKTNTTAKSLCHD